MIDAREEKRMLVAIINKKAKEDVVPEGDNERSELWDELQADVDDTIAQGMIPDIPMEWPDPD